MDDPHGTTKPIAPDSGASVPASGGIPRVGEIIAERYRVESVLGQGGMGVVLAVTHLQLNEPYAIKFLRPDQQDAEMVERFLREARAAVRIKSDHIARVNDVGRLPDGSPFILMEYLVGRDLATVLTEQGPLPVREAAEYVLQACAGIAEAHALGIVHRDLKPSNLFLTERSDGAPLVKVLDFGIAKAMDAASTSSSSVTMSTSAFGSPAFMSPEQVRSFKRVDFRTDVWSLGVILFQLLTGELPFEAENVPGLLAAIAADEPLRVRHYRPEVPEALDAIVRECLERDLSRRIQTVRDLAERLEPFVANTLVSLGRIQRVSARADSGRGQTSSPISPPTPRTPRTPRASAPDLATTAIDVDAPTERAITTPTEAPPAEATDAAPRSSSSMRGIVGVALVVAAVVAGVFVLKKSPPDEASTVPPPALSNAASATPIPSVTVANVAPASAAPSSSVAPAPASASAQRAPAPAISHRPSTRATASAARPTPAVSSSSAVSSPSVPVAPPSDPTAESH